MKIGFSKGPQSFEAQASAKLSEQVISGLLALATAVPIMAVGGLAIIFVYESWLFFEEVPLWNFLTDTQWTPQFSSQKFGVGVLISATLLVSFIALVVAIPIGILSAIYLSECAPKSVKGILRPLVNALAGVPTIVYGYFALLLVTPYLQKLIPGLSIFNSLSAGVVTGLLVVPIIASFSEDALQSVDRTYRQAAYSCGFTRFELITRVLLPTAMPGIIASITLAASRVLGETMIAAIAAGQSPKLTFNPLVPVETMTAFIVRVSLGDVPTNSLLFHTIFAVGMVLFLITLALNVIGNWLVRRYSRTRQKLELPIARDTQPLALPCTTDGGHPLIISRNNDQFVSRLEYRQWRDRLTCAVGLLASLVGPLLLAVLTVVTLYIGLSQLNWAFLTSYTSSNPEKAGILGALAGTFWLLGLTAIFAIPIGVAAAIYLEEYVSDHFWSRFVEINLTNATAVPGILYGLLGVAVFVEKLRWLTGGRSILAASLMMTLLVLPLLIAASRTALSQVPKSLKRAGYAVGMSRWQVIWHVILPAARPGLLTGILLTGSRIVGEASPLIAIGAIEFITFMPSPTLKGIQSPFTTLTTQIFYWLSRPQPVFQAKAAAAVIVLGGMVFGMNVLSSVLRDRLKKTS